MSTTRTNGPKAFDPESLFSDTDRSARVQGHLKANQFRSAIIEAFSLPADDDYVYHATASVTLSQVQAAVDAGSTHGLHDWYYTPSDSAVNGNKASAERNVNGGGRQMVHVGRPSISDIASYVSLFDPSKAAANTLKGLKANAKKDSLKAGIADYLSQKRHVDQELVVAKRKRQTSVTVHPSNTAHVSSSSSSSAKAAPAPPSDTNSQSSSIPRKETAIDNTVNPYIDFWAWSCLALEYAGPDANTIHVKTKSHHVLPVFMHHFGCVCPSYEALEMIRKLSQHRTVLDMGSGNGYWTLMLRRQGCEEVIAIDNGQSSWRTAWISDTINTDGVAWLKKRYVTTGTSGSNGGSGSGKVKNKKPTTTGAASTGDEEQKRKGDVLLLVYPVVGLDFTTQILDAFQGDVICVAGTQNGNGYTGFKNETVDEWMARERKNWRKIAQIPLPSFAGKDDALFVFKG